MLKNLDKKQKAELVITGVGIIFLVFLVIGNSQKFQKKKMAMVTTGDVVTSSLSAPISFEQEKSDESAIKEGWGRDPFLLGHSSISESGVVGLVLNGIMWDPANPYAIINNDVVKLGDKLGDVTVTEITENSVILEQDGQRYTLTLNVY